MTSSTCEVIDDSGQVTAFDETRLRASLMSAAQSLDLTLLDIDYIVNSVKSGLPDKLSVESLVELMAEMIASMTTKYYQYSNLASMILQGRLRKKLGLSFCANAKKMVNTMGDGKEDASRKKLINSRVMSIIESNADLIDKQIDHQRDDLIDYFGFRTLEKSYLLKSDKGSVQETAQYLFMRVSLGIHLDDLDAAFETYHLMSQKLFIHASPTLFNSGTDFATLSSCFLLAMNDDSIDGIFKTVHECAMISKSAGGIGLHVSNIRASNTYISGTNGISSGLVPMLRVFNNTAKYVDQGGNKRPGAFCIYLEPWHSDVFEFLDLRKNHGKEELRARDLFYALWIPDLFMQKVESNDDWYLFSPDKAPGLMDVYGEEFNDLYEKYVQEGRQMKIVKARQLWKAILVSQTETGNPFLLYKDACNYKSNQKNLGTIKSSNLCCEIVEHSSPDEIAVCNLASIALPSFVRDDGGGYDFEKLHKVSKVAVKNLNKIIDIGQYPLEKCSKSNFKNRPIGLGVQGLADVFFKMRMAFGSPESRKLNVEIFETIYHASLEASMELAQKYGSYDSYEGSPLSQGIFQFDMWNVKPSSLWDWSKLQTEISQFGVRNSLLVALMPTASTSQILGFNECFEPITSNIYSRRVLSGEHQVVNQYLIDDLVRLGLWNNEMKEQIIFYEGSIQSIDSIPEDLKQIYKTVWEMSQKNIIDLAADRAPFVDQSQSMNLFMENVSYGKLTSMHFYAWKKGLKTGIYYLRTKAAAQAIKFSINSVNLNPVKRKLIENLESSKSTSNKRRSTSTETPSVQSDDDDFSIFDKKILSCNLENPDGCESCSA